VAIHHIDENKKNNEPSNLIPLCPNHHEMCHSKWKSEIEPFINEWQQNFICTRS
jgi:predicted HNH restriction endonuclease